MQQAKWSSVVVRQAGKVVVDYAALFDQLPTPYYLIGTDDPNFTFASMSVGYERMTGVPAKSAIGRPVFDVFPDVSKKYRETGISDLTVALRTVIRKKKPFTRGVFRYDIADTQGNYLEKYWQATYYPLFDDMGAVSLILCSSSDMTEELQQAKQLRELQEQHEEALNIGKVGSWIWNAETGLIVANKTLAKIFDMDPKQAIKGLPSQLFMQAIHPEDRDRVYAEIQHAIKDGTNFETECRTLSKNKHVRWILARGRLNDTKSSTMASFPGVIVDITERHNLEAEIEGAHLREELRLREAELLLKRNEELETVARTKDEFVALASHQLRTPATAVKQYVGMVLQGYVGDITETQTDMLEKAFESNERQIQIINQILNAARVDTGRLLLTIAPLDLRGMLKGIIDEMRTSIELKGHTLTVLLPKHSLIVAADSGYLRMAIENVLHNASIYTPSPGTITLALKKTSKHACITITDTGVGIKKADLDKLFNKFSRIHNPLSVAAGGSGIGLYLTAEILRLHGGSVTVESKIRKGTTFAISVPLSQNKR